MISYLINLDRDTERLDLLKNQFARLGAEFTRIKGTDGASLAADQYSPLLRWRPMSDNPENGWTTGQIGCFLSHLGVWKTISEKADEFAAVFEDDVRLSPWLRHFLDSGSWIPDDADIIRLEATNHGMRLDGPVAKFHGIAIRRVLYNAWGTAGYIVRRDIAKWLANSPPRHRACGVDVFLFDRTISPVARALRVYQLDPALCVQRRFHPSFGGDFISETNPGGTEFTTFGPLKLERDHPVYLALRPALRVAFRRRAVRFAET